MFVIVTGPPCSGKSTYIDAHRKPGEPVFRLTPLPAEHGRADMIGWKIEHGGRAFAAIPDCKVLPPETLALCRGCDLVVVDALRLRPHPTHMNFAEAVAVLRQIGAPRSLVIHMCHEVSHAQAEQLLPEGMAPAWDGLHVDLETRPARRLPA